MIDDHWNTQKWKNVSAVNKRNRGSSGAPIHSGGSRSMIHTKLKMEKEKGGPVSFLELYDDYFVKKGTPFELPSQYTTQKAAHVREEYRCLAMEKIGSIPPHLETDLWEEACGGISKSRLFGVTKDVLHLCSPRTLVQVHLQLLWLEPTRYKN